jgi:hypothetical protein
LRAALLIPATNGFPAFAWNGKIERFLTALILRLIAAQPARRVNVVSLPHRHRRRDAPRSG